MYVLINANVGKSGGGCAGGFEKAAYGEFIYTTCVGSGVCW